jgi:hypothetical protein
MTDKKFLKSNGTEKVIRFLVNEEFCHRQCDFLEDDFCSKFDTRLKAKGENNYIARCNECLKFSKNCIGSNDCKICKI